MANAESLADVTDVVQILRQWEEEHSSLNYDPIPILQRLADIIELETENYMKMDPDPFDERHPSRTDPECNFGHILKVLFRKDNFMTKLINDYLRDTYWSRAGITGRDVRKLNIAACRLMLDILPGLETSAVFQPDMEGLIHRLFSWAEKSIEPLQSYSTGLLAAAMEVQDIATGFRDQNAKMVPLMLQRLHKLQQKAFEDRQQKTLEDYQKNVRPFAHFGQDRNNAGDYNDKDIPEKRKRREKWQVNGTTKNRDSLSSDENDSIHNEMPAIKKKKSNSGYETSVKNNDLYPEIMSPPLSIPKAASNSNLSVTPSKQSGLHSSKILNAPTSARCNLQKASNQSQSSNVHMTLEGNSNSSWAEMESYVIGSVQMYPPTLATRQMLILRYLTPMGEYQEFLGHVFEHNALELILKYINVRETKDSRLAFEALKYLASLLCHKKFSIEFLNVGGLQKLLDVPRPSVAATGVSICLYYLAYCEDAMERVCLLPKHIISDLVTYALWLLERSHDSGRCHATMFFGFSFPFKVILEEFDAQDGLRKLFNVISTLPILNIEEEPTINDDEECASRQIVRHVAVALKRYMEAHLHLKAEQLQRAENVRAERDTWQPSLPPYKPCKFSNEEVQAKVEILQELMSVRAVWPPVEELYRLGGITLLLQIIAFAREWNYSGRVNIHRNASELKRLPGDRQPAVELRAIVGDRSRRQSEIDRTGPLIPSAVLNYLYLFYHLLQPENERQMIVHEKTLKGILTPAYYWLFVIIGRLQNGVKFLVDLRTDVLELLSDAKDANESIIIQQLNHTLRDLFLLWFSIGFLHMERITWESACDILQKVSDYEAIHPMRNWLDLKRRVGPYRRCYIFTHPSMPREPIVVLHTALCDVIPDSVKGIEEAETRILGSAKKCITFLEEDKSKIKAAIFYSIVSTQKGLQGIELGNYLIKKVVSEITTEFPAIQQLSSLSPIPNFKTWLLDKLKQDMAFIFTMEEYKIAKDILQTENVISAIKKILNTSLWTGDKQLSEFFKEPFLRACAWYLYKEKRRGYALNTVANFHLRNGAVMWRINWMADPSPRGVANSCGVMVNYRYFLEDSEANSQNYIENFVINAAEDVINLSEQAEKLRITL